MISSIGFFGRWVNLPTRNARASLMFCALLAVPGQAFSGEPYKYDIIVHNARIVDVERESVSVPTTIAVRNGRISEIGLGRSASARRRINAKGRYMLPGLWDMHVHALWSPGLWPHAAKQFLSHCVVGVRDMGGIPEELARARTYRGAAPRLIAAGLILDGPSPVDPSISRAIKDGPDATSAVARLEGKADFVKLYTLFPKEAFGSVIAAARKMQYDVAGHVPYSVGALAASAAGMRSIEHMQAETGLYCDPDKPEDCDVLFAAFKANETWQTPTLVARSVRAHFFPVSSDVALASVREFPSEVRQLWKQSVENNTKASPQEIARKRKDFEREKKLAALLVARRVPLLAGSDAGLPLVPYGASLHTELGLLVAAGASPSSALRAGIVEPNKYLRRKAPFGIQIGAAGDFCLLDRNPLERIDHASASRLTVVAGHVGFDSMTTTRQGQGRD